MKFIGVKAPVDRLLKRYIVFYIEFYIVSL